MSNARSSPSRGSFPSLRRIFGAALVPAALSLTGCVILPVPTPPTGSEIVGDDSMKSIKPGVTTRADVLLELGDPSENEEADRLFAYDWKVSYGSIVWAWGITYNVGGAGGYRLWAYRCLAMEFGPSGTVTRTAYLHLESSEARNCLAAWRKQGDRGDEPRG